MKRVYFVRHGESEGNRDGILADARSSLTDAGRAQAKGAAESILARGIKIDKIFSSPFVRARVTADIIAEHISYPKESILEVPELRERHLGDLINTPKIHESKWYFDVNEGNGIETHERLYRRLADAWKKVTTYAAQDGDILIIGHACSGYALRLVAEGKKDSEHVPASSWPSNAELIEFKYI